jgi:hypothetical protein
MKIIQKTAANLPKGIFKADPIQRERALWKIPKGIF